MLRSVLSFVFAGLMSMSAVEASAAPQSLPISFDASMASAWEAKPNWLAYINPAVQPIKAFGAGTGVFAVTESQKAMKWFVPIKPTQAMRYLVLRYRASDLSLTPHEYLMWAYDGTHEANILLPENLRADNRWHTVVIDLESFGITFSLRGLAINLQAGEEAAAMLWLDLVDYADSMATAEDVIRAQD